MKTSITLILAILCSTSIALADTYTGTTGDCTYTLDTDEGTLVISGTGAMEDYSSSSSVPWYSYRSYVKTITIEDGVTSIGNCAFYECSSLTSITSLAATPPDCGSNPFSSYTYEQATLYAASNMYKYTTYWKDFTTIEYTDDAQMYSTTYIGQCGDNLIYTLDLEDGSVVIEGSGDMYDYDNYSSYAPWITYSDIIETFSLPSGMTSIGSYAFYNCSSLTSIIIGSSVTSIGQEAFAECSSLTSVTSLATTPPTCQSSSGMFSSSTYSSATLYAASTDYATADEWENFTNIVYDTSGNAISSVTASTSAIRAIGNTIVITTETAQTAQVYSLAGQLLVKQAVAAGETTIGMPTCGVYVVALTDGTKAKVLVK